LRRVYEPKSPVVSSFHPVKMDGKSWLHDALSEHLHLPRTVQFRSNGSTSACPVCTYSGLKGAHWYDNDPSSAFCNPKAEPRTKPARSSFLEVLIHSQGEDIFVRECSILAEHLRRRVLPGLFFCTAVGALSTWLRALGAVCM
jgi:hypothetical protein